MQNMHVQRAQVARYEYSTYKVAPPDRILRSTMVVVRLETPTEPPKWAVLEREMIQALSDACEEFFC